MSKLLPTMADVAREAGVSVVTVDRVLNKRASVRPVTERKVLEAAQRLQFALAKIKDVRGEAAPVIEPVGTKSVAFFLLRGDDDFYQALARSMVRQAGEHPQVRTHKLHYFDGLSPERCAELLLQHGTGHDAIALTCVDHPRINQAVDLLSQAGVRVCTFITDITASQRAGYVGIDNRKAGRTAAWAVSRLSRRPGKVGILLGDHRFLCQELCEISFRSYFREQAADFTLLDTRLTFESPDQAASVTGQLLDEHPDLVGLYVSCGGEDGVINALKARGRQDEVVVVTHDLTGPTRDALVAGVVDLTLSLPVEASISALIDLMVNTSSMAPEPPSKGFENVLIPFDINTIENI
ncbi:LacI family DNA-binding transcriptional regulator [Pseudomonas putida]|uniref:LacI family DNA-binding transcriptional regulator n=1 Tax=Pseudomonas putida TaxID=303 RepID=UPI003361CFF1